MNSGVISCAGKRVYIGLDVHRAFFVACCLCEGEVVKRCRIPSRAGAVISLITEHFPGAEVHTCYEAGYSGFWLHRELEAAGIKNIVVHTAGIEVAANNRVKTDKRDSLKLARQLSTAQLRGIRVPSLGEEYDRVLTRTREQLMRAKRRSQVQIRMRLHQFGLFPEAIQGALTLRDVDLFLDGLEGRLKCSIECLCSQWRHLVEQVKEIDKQLMQKSREDPLDEIYRSVPGIGKLGSRVLSNELGDMSQFRNVRALYSFTGLTPGEYSSGRSIHRGHVSRQGSARLRHILVEASWKAIRKDKTLGRFFEITAARAGKKRAIVAVARKLVGRVRAAIRDQGKYVVEHKEAA